jgi:hypothetical protein
MEQRISISAFFMGAFVAFLILLFSRGKLHEAVGVKIIPNVPGLGFPQFDEGDLKADAIVGVALPPISSLPPFDKWNCPAGSSPWRNRTDGQYYCVLNNRADISV